MSIQSSFLTIIGQVRRDARAWIVLFLASAIASTASGQTHYQRRGVVTQVDPASGAFGFYDEQGETVTVKPTPDTVIVEVKRAGLDELVSGRKCLMNGALAAEENVMRVNNLWLYAAQDIDPGDYVKDTVVIAGELIKEGQACVVRVKGRRVTLEFQDECSLFLRTPIRLADLQPRHRATVQGPVLDGVVTPVWLTRDLDDLNDFSEDPNLPRVLLVGDSISMDYTPFVRSQLANRADVWRIPHNGGPTHRMMTYRALWLGPYELTGFGWDVIVFNFGLHDLRIKDGKNYTDIRTYQQNLRQIVRLLQATKARLLWAATTPVPPDANPGSPWGSPVNADVIRYNQAAAKIMEENGIAVIDLYSPMFPVKAELLRAPGDIHFNEQGSEILGRAVADAVAVALPAERN